MKECFLFENCFLYLGNMSPLIIICSNQCNSYLATALDHYKLKMSSYLSKYQIRETLTKRLRNKLSDQKAGVNHNGLM